MFFDKMDQQICENCSTTCRIEGGQRGFRKNQCPIGVNSDIVSCTVPTTVTSTNRKNKEQEEIDDSWEHGQKLKIEIQNIQDEEDKTEEGKASWENDQNNKLETEDIEDERDKTEKENDSWENDQKHNLAEAEATEDEQDITEKDNDSWENNQNNNLETEDTQDEQDKTEKDNDSWENNRNNNLETEDTQEESDKSEDDIDYDTELCTCGSVRVGSCVRQNSSFPCSVYTTILIVFSLVLALRWTEYQAIDDYCVRLGV